MEIEALYDKLKAEEAALLALTAPFKEKRKQLHESIRPVLDEIRELENKIKATEQPRLRELQQELQPLTEVVSKLRRKAERRAAAQAENPAG